GRKVSLSAPAVRERLRRLEERGILHGYWVSINPAVFGREDLLVSFGGEWSRDEAIRALGGPDVAWVAWKVDGGVTVEVWPYDVEKAVPALEQFLGHPAIWQGVSRVPLKHELSGLDWRSLEAVTDALCAIHGARCVVTRPCPNVSSVQLSLNREFTVGTDFVHRLVREGMERSERARARE